MREIVYVSERKLEWEFSDASWRLGRRPGVEASAGLPGTGMKVSMPPASSAEPLTSTELAFKLERVIRYLKRTHRPQPFTTPSLRVNQWITFDLNMKYGTAHEDTARYGTPDDVALFGGTAPTVPGSDNRPVELLLCGSVHHLRSQIASHGRMGSDTTWLYELTKELNRREQTGLHVIPEFLTEIVPRNLSVLAPDHVAHEVFGGLMRSTHPRPDYGRLRGHARVLMDIDAPSWITRLVLATPLYIERPPPRLSSRWRRRHTLDGKP
ncbi:SAVMC3_10250 family protein [Amycolatopsis arida]|nr:SAVMC3_10250 family protein [Amycolatopsis arida]